MSRQLTRNWIDSYISLIEPTTQSPVHYHEWCAATVVAASLKRHVWIDRKNFKLYPNLFTILVGHPGLGKGEAANPSVNLLNEAGTANMMSDRITMEFVLEKLSKGFAGVHPTSMGFAVGGDSTALVYSPELSIFITASQYTLPILADLWDARDGIFSYGTRTKGEVKIKDPCLSLLGASTQEWLVDSIPTNAVGGGFTRRVNFVYGKERSKSLPWPTHPNGISLRDKLVQDLRHISTLNGQFSFDKNATSLFSDFHAMCTPIDFDDEATVVYTTSMPYHVLKLSMVVSACERDDLMIDERCVKRAIAMVEKCKKDIAMVFRAVGESDFAGALDRVLRFIESKGYVSRQEILRANYRHVASTELDVVLLTLRDGGIIEEEQKSGRVFYRQK